MQQIRFKKTRPDAVTPSKANASDAGFDLTAVSMIWSDDFHYVEYGTGIAVEIPQNWVGLIFQRSSVSRVRQILSNCVGVVDSGYRGEIRFRFRDAASAHVTPKDRYKIKDKIGQILFLPLPPVELVEASELSGSDRGEAGFGSSGN